MKSNPRTLIAAAALALAVLACNALSGGGNDVPPVDVNPPGANPTEAPILDLPPILGGDTLLRDDFASSQWGTGSDADSSVEYVGEALNFFVIKDLYFVWSTPNDEDYQNVHIEVTASNNSTDSTGAFGIICNMQVTDVSHYVAITGAGQYAIGKSALAADDVFLTNNNEWGNSSLIKQGASSYRIGADCGNGALTLYVDGQQVDSATDSTYTSGNVALFAWSGEQVSGTNVTFDDFVMTKLP
jgi:hypothetical protein